MTETKNTPRGQYKTRGQEAILQVLRERGGSGITATELYRLLRNAGSSIGQTTVYRQLCRLSDMGTVRKLQASDVKDALYFYCETELNDQHYHLVCNTCGRVTHLSCDFFGELFSHIEKEHGFRVDGGRTLFYGLCAACRRKEKQMQHGGGPKI